MSTTNPAIVIVPGAFYSPWHYRHLHTGLESAGYIVTTVSLASTGGEIPQPDGHADFNAIATAIKAFIDQGRNVVVVMHSWGGWAGSCACKGLLPADQSNGKGVVGLVYMCAGAPVVGMSFMDGSGGHNFPWARLIGDDAQPNTGVFMFCDNDGADPGQLFFHDCDAETRAEAVRRLSYWSEGCLWTKAIYAPQMEVESNYLVCTDDQSGLTVEMQEMMTATGMFKLVERLGASHSPFLSKPAETVRFVRKCCGENV